MEQRSDAELQAILEENLAADLMSMFPDSYRSEHQNAQYRQLSYAAKINLRTLDELYDNLRDEPEVNLLSIFPKNYTRRITMATGPKILPVTSLLARYSGDYLNESNDAKEESLTVSLKKLLWDSPKLWESPVRGIVVKRSDEIVAKVITGNTDSTEYTSME
ncbi:hypothetical protein DPV78_011109 [Talaromyces pinophilus]|nr:hypothetical protein DPV78_011109 [Talaromyces pinophilus]